MRICPQCEEETEAPECPRDGNRTVLVRSVEPEDPWLGRVFEGRYRIDALLGRGGFGAVYRAEQLGIGRAVAVKILEQDRRSTLADVARFQQEAKTLASLEHPGIVTIFDFGQSDDGALYLVMELLRGRSLEELVAEQGPLSGAAVIEIALQTADAVAEAHALGIVHRDLKPANLFLAEDTRGRCRLKVLDFGIARMTRESSAVALTATGMMLGSPPFMSPEQCQAQTVTVQSDIYSLGCTLYLLLSGEYVIKHTSAQAMVMAHCIDPPDAPMRDGVPLEGPLIDLVMQMLAKQPMARPHLMEGVISRLDSMHPAPLTGPGAALAGAALPRMAQLPRRSRPAGSDAMPMATSREAVAVRPHGTRKLVLALTGIALVSVAGIVGVVASGAPQEAGAAVIPAVVLPRSSPSPEAGIAAAPRSRRGGREPRARARAHARAHAHAHARNHACARKGADDPHLQPPARRGTDRRRGGRHHPV